MEAWQHATDQLLRVTRDLVDLVQKGEEDNVLRRKLKVTMEEGSVQHPLGEPVWRSFA